MPAAPKKELYHDYVKGDIVLCKLKGYPAWPGKVYVRWQGKRPGNAGLWWCVVFFPKGDHYWARAGEMQQLTPDMIDTFLNSPKKGPGKDAEMIKGYKIARDPREWEAIHLSGPPRAYEGPDDPDDGGGGHAVKVPPSKETHRKTARVASASVSESEGDAEAGMARPSESESGKRARRGSSSSDDGGRGRREERVRVKKKRVIEPEGGHQRSEKKKPRTAASRASTSASAEPPKKTARKSASSNPTPHKKVTYEAYATPEEEAVDDESIDWVRKQRVHLQRHFIDAAEINPSEMYLASQKLKELENWEMTVQQIRQTKIGKVLSRIANPNKVQIPQQDPYRIAERCAELVRRWSAQLGSLEADRSGRPLVTQQPSSSEAPLSKTLSAAVEQQEEGESVQQRRASHSQPLASRASAAHEHNQQPARIRPEGTSVQQPDVHENLANESPIEILDDEDEVELFSREPSPVTGDLGFRGHEHGDTIIVCMPEEDAVRVDSSKLSEARVWHNVLQDPDCARDYVASEDAELRLKTLRLSVTQQQLFVFLHVMLGTEPGEGFTDFHSLWTVLTLARAYDAPNVREVVILRLLDKLHASRRRVGEVFALGCAFGSNRLVSAALPLFDGPPTAASVAARGKAVGGAKEADGRRRIARRVVLSQIEPELYTAIPTHLLREFYELENMVICEGRLWSDIAKQFKFI